MNNIYKTFSISIPERNCNVEISSEQAKRLSENKEIPEELLKIHEKVMLQTMNDRLYRLGIISKEVFEKAEAMIDGHVD